MYSNGFMYFECILCIFQIHLEYIQIHSNTFKYILGKKLPQSREEFTPLPAPAGGLPSIRDSRIFVGNKVVLAIFGF